MRRSIHCPSFPSRWRPQRRFVPRVLAFALLAAALPLAAPHARAAEETGAHRHGLGLARPDGAPPPRLGWRLAPHIINGTDANGASSMAADAPRVQASAGPDEAGAAAPPVSADISQYSPPVADQGDVNACVAWVTTYYMRGWYARRDGYYPDGGAGGGFAPMYLYSQLTNGSNIPTSFNQTLDLQVAQGVDTRADYAQGDTDYADGPTAAERASAASYRISGYTVLFQGGEQGDAARAAIEASIAGGDPVGLGLPVYDNFWNADAGHSYIDGAPGVSYGNHTVFATRYDANGLWVENQWGTGWGRNGWVELSWPFVDQYVWEAVTIRPLAAPISSAASIAPTATVSAATASATSVPEASATSVPAATATVAATTQTMVGAATMTPSTASGATPRPASSGSGSAQGDQVATIVPAPMPATTASATATTATPSAVVAKPVQDTVTTRTRERASRPGRGRGSRTTRTTGTTRAVIHSARAHGNNITIGHKRARDGRGRMAYRGVYIPLPAHWRAGRLHAVACARRLYGHTVCV